MNDEHFMKQALQQAQKAYDEDEVPVGTVIVINNKIIAKGYNQVEKLNDCTAHAEIIALTSAFNYLGSKYLPDATIYITIEPCLMCAGALYWSKIGKIIYGAPDEKNGYLRWVSSPEGGGQEGAPFHPKTVVVGNFMRQECSEIIQRFFQQKRRKKPE
jgi:tRNA(adenine34) deaminase